jgi:hypothetical protein
MLSVYTRHQPSCKNAGDKTWRRCNCPKWIWGSHNGQFIRQSAKTHSWEVAEELRRQLTEALTQPSRPTPEMPSNPVLAAPTSAQPRVAPPLAAEEITPVQHRKPRVNYAAGRLLFMQDLFNQHVKGIQHTLKSLNKVGTAKVVDGSQIPFRSVLTEIPDRPVQRNDSLRKGHCERSVSVEP